MSTLSLLGVGSTQPYGLPWLKCILPIWRSWRKQQSQICNKVRLGSLHKPSNPPNPQKKTQKKSYKEKPLKMHKFSQLISTSLPSPPPQDPTTRFVLLVRDRQVIWIWIWDRQVIFFFCDLDPNCDLAGGEFDDLEPNCDLAWEEQKWFKWPCLRRTLNNFAGIHMALSLKDRGFSDVVIFERWLPFITNHDWKPRYLEGELCGWKGSGHCGGGDSISIGGNLDGQAVDQLSAIGR